MNLPFPIRSVDVLHVDDDADVREIIGTSIGSDPIFTVRGCASGEEALVATAKWSPDLILLDLKMPGMDGQTTLARLREQPHTASVPVIFVTAVARAKGLDDLWPLGVAGVITKPFDPTTLCAQISAILCRCHRKLANSHVELERKAALALAIDDITHKKRAEERFRLVVESAPTAMVMIDKSGRIVLVNRKTEKVFGYASSELVGQKIEFLMPAAERGQHQGRIDRYFVSPAVLDSSERAMGAGRELYGLRKDGSEFPVEIGLTPINTDDGIMVLGAVVDVSERKRAEERFRLVVESAPTAMVMIDKSGRIVLVNRKTEKLFGYASSELLGQKIELLMPAAARGQHQGRIDHYFVSPAVLDSSERAMGAGRELYGLRKDGSEFPVEIGLTPINTDDGIMVLGAVVDITIRKQAEDERRQFNQRLEQQVTLRTAQLEAANKELDDFAYAASHDLKAPLRVIDNASRWLEEDLAPHLNDETRENMRLLRSRVTRLEKLLDDLLRFSHVGRETGAVEIVSGKELIDDVLAVLPLPEDFELKVASAFATMRVARLPLQQILMNLISNAIKHHDKATGRIEVAAADLGSQHAFAVKDDGPGIPAQFHDKIFKMFQTLKPRDQVEGSGMGLAIVRKQVELSGGLLSLESAEGKGSTFHFTLPAPRCDKEQQ
jgi:PAS domain S-box-containing protein